MELVTHDWDLLQSESKKVDPGKWAHSFNASLLIAVDQILNVEFFWYFISKIFFQKVPFSEVADALSQLWDSISSAAVKGMVQWERTLRDDRMQCMNSH